MQRQGSVDDILPSLLGACCIFIGYFIRNLKDAQKKQWISSALGLLCVLCVCRTRAWHPLVMILVNAVIICYGNKRRCFITSFTYTFAHLLGYYLAAYLSNQRPHVLVMGVLMPLVWKMIHLAGEVQNVYIATLNKKEEQEQDPRMKVYGDMTLGDFLHYSCCHVGVLVFFRYQTYYDWLHCHFHIYARSRREIRRMLITVMKTAVVLGLSHFIVPAEYVLSDEFRGSHFVYKLVYSVWVGSHMQCFVCTLFMLADMHCVMAGMGAYPVASNPKPGLGPSQRFELLEELAKDTEKAQKEEYNFVTTSYVNFEAIIAATTIRDFWNNFNRVSQYALIANVYKIFPVKRLRLLATFLVTTVWHEYTFFRHVSTVVIAAYVIAEHFWYSLLRKDATGTRARVVNYLFMISTKVMMAQTSLGIFFLEDLDRSHTYFSSVHYFPVVYTCMLIMVGLVLSVCFKPKKQI